MSLLRHGSAAARRLLLSQPKPVTSFAVVQQSRCYSSKSSDSGSTNSEDPDDNPKFAALKHTEKYYEGEPPGYDYTHLEGPDQVQSMSRDPLTPEKRAELAAKYNLRPEDYVPLNDDGITLGDYPKLPCENALERDPHYDWDDPILRRNFGEPVFHDANMYNQIIGPDTRPMVYDRPQMWKVLLTFLSGFFACWLVGQKFKWFLPRSPKQYPEYYPCDEIHDVAACEWLENRGTGNVIVKERIPVEHRTFPKEWNPTAH